MKVDDICDVITTSSDPSQIKLVFLRYIGPFRPSAKSLQSEGNFLDETDDKPDHTDRESNSLWKKNPIKKKAGFRLFGRGKNNNSKTDAKGIKGKVP